MLKKEVNGYQELPVMRLINSGIEQRNYLQSILDVQEIIQLEMERLITDPALMHIVMKKVKTLWDAMPVSLNNG